MATIFSKIITGEIPSFKVYEDGKFFAFLDINPLAKGHTLLVPKQEVDYIFDVEDDLLSEMIVIAKKIAKGIEKVIPCERVGVAVIGLEVPHCHIHLSPLNGINDLNFSNPKLKLSNEEMANIARKIGEAI